MITKEYCLCLWRWFMMIRTVSSLNWSHWLSLLPYLSKKEPGVCISNGSWCSLSYFDRVRRPIGFYWKFFSRIDEPWQVVRQQWYLYRFYCPKSCLSVMKSHSSGTDPTLPSKFHSWCYFLFTSDEVHHFLIPSKEPLTKVLPWVLKYFLPLSSLYSFICFSRV